MASLSPLLSSPLLFHYIKKEKPPYIRASQTHCSIQSMESQPHALVIPFPAQGHVIPLLELSYCLADRGFKITFVNTDYNHRRVIAAMSKENRAEMGRIRMVSIPDGLGPGDDRNDLAKLTQGFLKVMPGCLEDLILGAGEKITCMIADQSMGWALEIAKKTGIRSAAFTPASGGLLAVFLSIPKLMEDGVIDEDGVPKQETIQLIPGMPPMNTSHFSWNCFPDAVARRIIFNYVLIITKATTIAEHIICNSFYEVEMPAFTYAPNILPVGPLLTGGRSSSMAVGHFWPEDTTCTSWLDDQPPNSVIYVAFGSFTILDKHQFQELALALELTGRRFLWVMRPDLTDGEGEAYPVGFKDRIAGRGKMVGWSPQQRVLAHPAIACFLSHCGWNSTMEGVRNGVPFLCWPYFVDQFFNQSYICDVWRTGLRLVPDESGLITKEQIKRKVEELLGDDDIRNRTIVLKEKAERSMNIGGTSFENFKSFAHAMK